MAQRYTLIPASLEKKPATKTTEVQRGEDENTSLNIQRPIVVEEKKIDTPLATVLSLLPKRLRNKGKILLHYLDGEINLDGSNRIIYSDNSLGSHLLDLIRYYTTSAGINIHRPVDAPQFGLLLKRLGVPDAALGRPIVLKRVVKNKNDLFTDEKAPISENDGRRANRSNKEDKRGSKKRGSIDAERFVWRKL